MDHSYDFKFQNRHVQTQIEFLEKSFENKKNDETTKYIVKAKNLFRAIVPGQVKNKF